ncbi:tetratricopeptide repeat protein [Alkaliflexus imshenetskii]|uniref:tetratricopeptide repeat protein n=1 Tax=Alkaliflexus imshenetskii TaxID=286730 RepID=UPI0004786E9E|nr:tetratricopeptide repeat protein [Alkaliflexus imshenetskii]
MTGSRSVRYVTLLILVILLPIMLYLSLDAGISGDEYLHLEQAEAVVDFYTSFGKDTTALHTPVTNLKYYGQSYDNLASLIARITGVEDIFTLRHLMAALAGWSIILLVVMVSVRLSGWRTALAALAFIALSPGFIGHSFNNLKDIPFALSYLASIYFLSRWIDEWPLPDKRTIAGLIFSIAFAISIRPPGLIVIAYLGLITLIMFLKNQHLIIRDRSLLKKTAVTIAGICIAGYFLGLIFWPFALLNPIKNPVVSHFLMESYPVTIRQLYMGKLVWSDMLPWHYLPWMMLITIPVMIPVSMPGLFINLKKSNNRPLLFLLIFSTIFPLVYIILKNANVYGGWRHVLFIYPPIVILSAHGLSQIRDWIKKKWGIVYARLFLVIPAMLLIHPLSFMIKNHPLQYLYFNQITSGYHGAFGKYEADYYFHSIRPAAEWLQQHLETNDLSGKTIASNFETAWFFRHSKAATSHKHTSFYNRSFENWDYAIFSATYLHAHTLNEQWPPAGTIHTINLEGRAVCAVVKRTTLNDFDGWIKLQEGDTLEAIRLLKQATEIDPSLEGAWLNLGRSYLRIKDHDAALEALNNALMIHPAFEPALFEKAKVFFEIGKDELAVATLEKILGSNQKYLPAYILMADHLEKNGDKIKAIEYLQQSLKIQPSYRHARERLLQLTKN